MPMIYRFEAVESCNMCRAPASDAKVIGRRLSRSQGIRPTRRTGVTTSVVRCRACGLVFCDPVPVPLDAAQHYGMPPEDYWKAEYFEAGDAYFIGEIDRFFELWGNRSSPSALDIGAGLGMAMVNLAKRGFDTFGLEPSEPFHARSIDAGIDPERLQLATVEEAEFPPGRFDFVTFGAVLEHLVDPAGAIERALGWTAADGLIHIDVPSARWLTSRLVNLAYRLQGLDYAANVSPMHVPYHLYEFTLDAFKRHGERAGYAVAHHRVYVGQTFLPRGLDPLAARIMRATGTGMQLEVWLRAR